MTCSPAARGPCPQPTSCVRRSAGSARRSERLTMRADSGFYAHAVVAVCRSASRSRSASSRASPADRGDSRGGLDADRVLAGGRRRCRRGRTPLKGEHDAASVRRRRRRELALFAWSALELEADHRRHAAIRAQASDSTSLRRWRLARGPGDRPQPCSLDGRIWRIVTTKTLRRRLFASPALLVAHAPSAGRALGAHRRPRPAAGDPAPDLTASPTAPSRAPPHRSLLLSAAAPSHPASATNRSRTPQDDRFALRPRPGRWILSAAGAKRSIGYYSARGPRSMMAARPS